MTFVAFSKTITALYDAALDEERWNVALEAIAEFVGIEDIGYLLFDKKFGTARSVGWWGSFAGNSADYLNHYSKIDPFRAVQESAACGQWVRLSETLPPTLLSRDEWYNDFILGRGMCDILGAKLHESDSHFVLIGLQRAVGDRHAFPRNLTRLRMLADPLRQAARVHMQLVEIRYKSAIVQEALDCLAGSVIFADADARVLATNQSAESILSLGDGLTVQNKKLCARRSFETAKLLHLIATAASAAEPSAGCMPIARAGGGAPYVVSVAPVGVALAVFNRPVAMVAISAPAGSSASESELAELFALSPAESRVALALTRGKRPAEIAREFGVQITTVRAQLRSIRKKLGAERQSDIIRLVSSIPGR